MKIVFQFYFSVFLLSVYKSTFNFVSCNPVKFIYWFYYLFCKFLRLFWVNNDAICKKRQFYFLLTFMSFIYFSYIITPTGTYNTTLNGSGQRGHPCFVSSLRAKGSLFYHMKDFNLKWTWRIWNGEFHTHALRRREI